VKPLALAVASLFALPALAELPSSFPIPPKCTPRDDQALTWSEASFPLTEEPDNNVQRGKTWHFSLSTTAVPAEAEHAAIWNAIKGPLLKAGWTVAKEWAQNPLSEVLKLSKGGKETWAVVTLFSPDDINVVVVEVGPQPLAITLKSPGPKPETLDENTDFPWLTPLPNSESHGGSTTDVPMLVSTGPESTELVGTGSITRSYAAKDEKLSPLQCVTVYGEALKKAGWSVVHESHGLHQSDATLTANYGKNGRLIWAYLHCAGAEYAFTVADVSKQDLAAQLAKDCRVPLYGVLFDFDKSTLKPASDAVLTRARDALKANPKLKIEVQGHTDNVGNDAYNVKLSGERAASVVAWLTKNGIPAAQLTSKGYGKSKPVVPNDSAENQARNRRVELACQK
jgi:hypothetical protein